MEEPKQNYDDIIMLPHHISSVHPAMPVSERAAQFMPFAALTGYGEAIDEAGREWSWKRMRSGPLTKSFG